jgi:fido (protein-threonine AMPylation protein)
MSHDLELLPGEPIVLLTLGVGYNADEAKQINDEIHALVKDQPGRFFRVADASHIEIIQVSPFLAGNTAVVRCYWLQGTPI